MGEVRASALKCSPCIVAAERGIDMWLLKKGWKVMHNWPHTTPNKDSNFPIYLEADDSDGSHTNLCRSYFKTKKVNLAEVEAATECYFSQKLLLVDPDLLLLEKKNSYFSWGNTLKLLSMLYFPIRHQNNPWTRGPLPHQLGLCGRKTSTSMQYCASLSYR